MRKCLDAMSFLMLSVMSVSLTGCAYLAKPTVPMDAISYDAPGPAHKTGLIVFLRGIGGSHRSFAEYGFVSAVRKRGLPFRMIAPNAHFGYYRTRTLDFRLQHDIIGPALAEGYRPVWLVGVSMGGLGSLLYERRYSHNIRGIVLIAPYLGDDKIIAEIREAGGLAKWDPGSYDPDEQWQTMLWAWIKDYAEGSHTQPELYLAYGLKDRYVAAQYLLAESLPEDHVVTVQGGHDIETFRELWLKVLDREPFE